MRRGGWKGKGCNVLFSFQIWEAGGVAGEELSIGQDALNTASGHAGAETSTKGKYSYIWLCKMLRCI